MLVLKSQTQINGLSPCKCKGDAVRLSQRSVVAAPFRPLLDAPGASRF